MNPLEWLSEPELDTAAVIRECGPEVGGVLVRTLEDLRSWIAARGGAESDLSLHPAPEEGKVREWLLSLSSWVCTLHALMRDPEAAETERERVTIIAENAGVIAGWAEEAGCFATARAFAQTAAVVQPRESRHACAVGRVARKEGDLQTAGSWLARARKTARERRDHEALALALQGIGHVHRVSGAPDEARRAYEAAFEATRKHVLLHLLPDIQYDRCLLELEQGRPAAAVPFYEQAFHLYTPGDLRLFQLFHDVGWTLLDGYGVHDPTYYLFDVLLETVWEPAHRLLVHAHRARAAAGAGYTAAFETSWNEALALVRDPRTGGRGHTAALVQLALGALTLRDPARARDAASRALDAVRHERSGTAREEAERIHRALSGDSEEEQRAVLAPRIQASIAPEIAEQLCMLSIVRLRLRDTGEVLSPVAERIGPRRPKDAGLRF